MSHDVGASSIAAWRMMAHGAPLTAFGTIATSSRMRSAALPINKAWCRSTRILAAARPPRKHLHRLRVLLVAPGAWLKSVEHAGEIRIHDANLGLVMLPAF